MFQKTLILAAIGGTLVLASPVSMARESLHIPQSVVSVVDVGRLSAPTIDLSRVPSATSGGQPGDTSLRLRGLGAHSDAGGLTLIDRRRRSASDLQAIPRIEIDRGAPSRTDGGSDSGYTPQLDLGYRLGNSHRLDARLEYRPDRRSKGAEPRTRSLDSGGLGYQGFGGGQRELFQGADTGSEKATQLFYHPRYSY